MVPCWTLANLRMTTSPPRGSIPQTGGFSLASGPRPRLPFRRLRLPRRPVFPRLLAGLSAQPQWTPRHMPPHRFRGVTRSWRPCHGVTEPSADGQHRCAARVPWRSAQSRAGVPCNPDTASTAEAVDDGQQRWCESPRRHVAHRTCIGSAGVRMAYRRTLVWCALRSHHVDTAPRLASVRSGRCHNTWRRRCGIAGVSWRQYRPLLPLKHVPKIGEERRRKGSFINSLESILSQSLMIWTTKVALNRYSLPLNRVECGPFQNLLLHALAPAA